MLNHLPMAYRGGFSTNAASSASAIRKTPPTPAYWASTLQHRGRSQPGSPRSTAEDPRGARDGLRRGRLRRREALATAGQDRDRPRPLLDGGRLAADQRAADCVRYRPRAPGAGAQRQPRERAGDPDLARVERGALHDDIRLGGHPPPGGALAGADALGRDRGGASGGARGVRARDPVPRRNLRRPRSARDPAALARDAGGFAGRRVGDLRLRPDRRGSSGSARVSPPPRGEHSAGGWRRNTRPRPMSSWRFGLGMYPRSGSPKSQAFPSPSASCATTTSGARSSSNGGPPLRREGEAEPVRGSSTASRSSSWTTRSCGTTSRKIVRMLREAGAKEVHVRVASPPTMKSCHYGIDTPTSQELIAANQSVGEIQKFIEADSLGYLSVECSARSAGRSRRPARRATHLPVEIEERSEKERAQCGGAGGRGVRFARIEPDRGDVVEECCVAAVAATAASSSSRGENGRTWSSIQATVDRSRRPARGERFTAASLAAFAALPGGVQRVRLRFRPCRRWSVAAGPPSGRSWSSCGG
jgi:hypothetical protein